MRIKFSVFVILLSVTFALSACKLTDVQPFEDNPTAPPPPTPAETAKPDSMQTKADDGESDKRGPAEPEKPMTPEPDPPPPPPPPPPPQDPPSTGESTGTDTGSGDRTGTAKVEPPPPPPPPPPKEPPPPPPIVDPPPQEPAAPMITDLQTVYFDFDKSEIKNEFKIALRENYEWVKANPGTKIMLEGHADERGTNEYNLALGERRAKAVLAYLVALGADPDQFSIVSFGEERPASFGSNEASWAKNRRVEFTRL